MTDQTQPTNDELAFIAPMAERILLRMQDEGGTITEVAEYVDDLIAFTRGNHPELESDPDRGERWLEIRRLAIAATTTMMAANN